MKIIISPARRMKADLDSLPYHHLPQYLDKSKEILAWLRTRDYQQLQQLWGNCSDRIVQINYQRIKEMDLTRNLTPAILAFQGLQYQYLGAGVMTETEITYIEQNLRIFSGFYGLLRPFDGITLYRLGMGDHAAINGYQNLYDYWGSLLYEKLFAKDQTVLNLASQEYSRAITPYLQVKDQFITCVFGEEINGKVKQKATLAKIARGNMVHYLAENNVQTLAELKRFTVGGYVYREDLSDEQTLYFVLSK